MESLISECTKSIPLDLKLKVNPYIDNDGKVNGGFFVVSNVTDGDIVSKFTLEKFSGCNGIVISRKVVVTEKYRGKGYGSIFCKLRELISKELGYSAIMCTVVLGNNAQERIMAKNEWLKLTEFLNLKTNNTISIYYKKL